MSTAGPLRVAHLTTIDMSLWWLLRTALEVGLAAGFEVYGISAPGPFVGEGLWDGARRAHPSHIHLLGARESHQRSALPPWSTNALARSAISLARSSAASAARGAEDCQGALFGCGS